MRKSCCSSVTIAILWLVTVDVRYVDTDIITEYNAPAPPPCRPRIACVHRVDSLKPLNGKLRFSFAH